MAEFEERLREAVADRSHAYEPSPDLPDRIAARVAHRRRVRWVVAGVAASAAAAGVLAVVTLVSGADQPGSLRIDGPPRTPRSPGMTESTEPPTTTVPPTPPPGPSTTVTTPRSPAAGPGGPGQGTTQTRRGWGPVSAGMTVREAEASVGAAIAFRDGGTATCREAVLGSALPGAVLLVQPAGSDPLDGVVRAVVGSVMPSEEGAMVGQTRAELVSLLGEPTGTTSSALGEVLLFEAGGFAYGALVMDDLVLGLQSGDPAWVHLVDGCAG